MDCGRFDELAALALSLGADAAAVFPVDGTIVDPGLAALCHETKCPNYGLAPTCPPHVRGPEWMMEYLKKVSHALFIKIEVKDEVIYSDQRREIGKLLHFIVIELEKEAHRTGFAHSSAFAGGSCKNLFCPDHYQCNVLYGDGACRHPDASRPSISGFGIQVKRLIEMAGWTPRNKREAKHNQDDVKRYGLILLDERLRQPPSSRIPFQTLASG